MKHSYTRIQQLPIGACVVYAPSFWCIDLVISNSLNKSFLVRIDDCNSLICIEFAKISIIPHDIILKCK